jgi:TPR repeat protein
MLRVSESVPSLAEARRLLERAAAQGHLSATRSLVTLLLRGRFGLRGRIEGVKLALDLMRSVSALERPAADSIVIPPAELVFDAPSAAI